LEEILLKKLPMINSLIKKQFILFVFVGTVSAIVNIIFRIIFNQWLSYSQAILMGYCMGILLAFILNFKFVFPASKKPVAQQFKGFILTNLFFLPIVWLASIGLRDVFLGISFIPAPDFFAHVAAVSIPLFFTFLIYKFSIFR